MTPRAPSKRVFQAVLGTAVFFNALCGDVSGGAGEQFLRSLDADQQRALTCLFHRLFFEDHWIYPLLGQKPIALSGGFIRSAQRGILHPWQREALFWKRWEAWKTWKEPLQIHHYLLLEEPSQEFPEICFLIFLNTDEFVKAWNTHRALFERLLGKSQDPAAMLEDLQSGTTTLQALVGHHPAIWGVLLGYGVINSELYAMREELEAQKRQLVPYGYEAHDRVQNKIAILEQHLLCCGALWSPLVPITPLTFSGDPEHVETQLLCEKYRLALDKIARIRLSDDFVLHIINQLIVP